MRTDIMSFEDKSKPNMINVKCEKNHIYNQDRRNFLADKGCDG